MHLFGANHLEDDLMDAQLALHLRSRHIPNTDGFRTKFVQRWPRRISFVHVGHPHSSVQSMFRTFVT